MYNDIVEFLKVYDDKTYIEIKQRLRQIREERGLKQNSFEKFGIPYQNYKQLEKISYKYKPSLESLIRICYALDISLKEFL